MCGTCELFLAIVSEHLIFYIGVVFEIVLTRVVHPPFHVSKKQPLNKRSCGRPPFTDVSCTAPRQAPNSDMMFVTGLQPLVSSS